MSFSKNNSINLTFSFSFYLRLTTLRKDLEVKEGFWWDVLTSSAGHSNVVAAVGAAVVLLCPDIGKVSPGPLGLQPRVSLSRPRSQSPASAASPGLCWGGPATAALTLEIEKKSNHRGWDYDLWNSFLLIISLGQLGHVNTFCDSKIKISFNALFLLVYYHQLLV